MLEKHRFTGVMKRRAFSSRFCLGYERFEGSKNRIYGIALEADPAASVRSNLTILYNLAFLIIKNLNSNMGDLESQVRRSDGPAARSSGVQVARSVSLSEEDGLRKSNQSADF